MNFLFKVAKKGKIQDEMMLVHFADEEGTTKCIKVHETHAEDLIPNHIYVVHRAKIVDGAGVIDAWSMVAPAPESYTWS